MFQNSKVGPEVMDIIIWLYDGLDVEPMENYKNPNIWLSKYMTIRASFKNWAMVDRMETGFSWNIKAKWAEFNAHEALTVSMILDLYQLSLFF